MILPLFKIAATDGTSNNHLATANLGTGAANERGRKGSHSSTLPFDLPGDLELFSEPDRAFEPNRGRLIMAADRYIDADAETVAEVPVFLSNADR